MGGSGNTVLRGVTRTERQNLHVLSYANADSIHLCECGQSLKIRMSLEGKGVKKKCCWVGAKGYIDMKLERRLMEEDTGMGR